MPLKSYTPRPASLEALVLSHNRLGAPEELYFAAVQAACLTQLTPQPSLKLAQELLLMQLGRLAEHHFHINGHAFVLSALAGAQEAGQMADVVVSSLGR